VFNTFIILNFVKQCNPYMTHQASFLEQGMEIARALIGRFSSSLVELRLR